MGFVKHQTGSYCLLQKMCFTTSETGYSTTNEYDCPMLEACNDVLAVISTNILTDMSVVHACNESCQFTETIVESGVERELVQSSKLVLKHDFSNNTYLLNRYALSYKF